MAYVIVGNDIYIAETWTATMHNLGPVGLAVDQNNENLFVSYEDFNGVEVFDARDATPLGTITLWGTDDLAGMVVHQTRQHLYVVDRREKNIFIFDTTTFAPVDQWILPTGNGAWGIDLMGDLLFVADGSRTVRYYDINTHQEVGNFTLSYRVTGIAVTDYPEPLVFCQGHDGSSGISPYFIKYAINSGIEELVTTGYNPKGVTLNPAVELGYSVADTRVHVIDTDVMTILNTKQLNSSWNPTDTVATAIPFGGTVSKTLPSHPNGIITMGHTASFEIEIENRSNYDLVMIPLEDIYDPTHFTFVSATPVPDNTTNGDIVWNDLTGALGNLPPGGTFTIYMDLQATINCTVDLEGVNLAKVVGALDSGGNPMYAAGVYDYLIECSCSVNADCDDGLWCNGLEICDVNGNCQSSPAPCEDDGLFCTGVESCDEVNDQCEATGNPCPDDGLFCTGVESCDEANDVCNSSGDPCGDDGLFCTGVESCDEVNDQCEATGDPCPDDGVFCNGGESCDEANDLCNSSGDPCGDDQVFCNGSESCDETSDTCVSSGDPCGDDSLFCNGIESCDENTDSCLSSGNPCFDDGKFCNGDEYCNEGIKECWHTGDPCPPDEYCIEDTDKCLAPPGGNEDDDDQDAGDEGLWPKGKVSGGCCGC